MIPKLNFYKYQSQVPIEVLDSAINSADRRYEINETKQNLIDKAFADMGGSPAEQEYINTVKAKIQGIKDNITKSVQGDTRWDLANSKVNEMANLVDGDKYISSIRQNYKTYQEEQASIAEMRKKGLTPLVFSDYSQHKSWDQEGNTKLYSSHVEPKGEYVGRMLELWKTVAPDIAESGLTPYDMNRMFLYNETVKGITKQDILNKLPQIKDAYLNDSVGNQHLRKLVQLDSKTDARLADPATADKDIERLLLSTGLLGTYQQKNMQFQQDPKAMLDAKTEEQAKLIKYRADLKNQAKNKFAGEEGSGKYLVNNDAIRTDDGGVVAKVKINNKTIRDSLAKDMNYNKAKVLDGTSNKDWDDLKEGFDISKFEPLGFLGINNTNDPQMDGAVYGTYTDKTGTYTIAYPADDNVKDNYKFVNDLMRMRIKNEKSKKSTGVFDETYSLASPKPDSPYANQNVPISLGIKYLDNGKYYYEPYIYNKETNTSKLLNNKQREELGLRATYSDSDVLQIFNNRLENDTNFLSSVDTASTINK